MATRRAAGWAFAAILPVAFVVNWRQGSGQWFFLDDWDLLAHRSLSASDLLRPHNEHWSTIPVVVYRVLWALFGLEYRPYQSVAFLSHLIVCVLLRVVLRRAGVGPWLATILAGAFTVFGAGAQAINFAFCINLTGAVAFGLGAFILVDHDGWDRRDWGGLACSVGALLCSGVAVPMIAGVGVAIWIRRGWKPALAHVLPPAVLYAVWFLVWGRDGFVHHRSELGDSVEMVGHNVGATFVGLGWPLAIAFAAGLFVAGRDLREHTVPIGCAVAGLGFITSVAAGRATEFGTGSASRYIYILAAMFLPLIGVGLAQWRWGAVAGGVFVLALVPVNVHRLAFHGPELYALGQRDVVLTVAHLPEARRVPGVTRLFRVEPDLTVGFLVRAERAGKVPEPSHPVPGEARKVLRGNS